MEQRSLALVSRLLRLISSKLAASAQIARRFRGQPRHRGEASRPFTLFKILSVEAESNTRGMPVKSDSVLHGIRAVECFTGCIHGRTDNQYSEARELLNEVMK
jgi:hypothetical protein